MTRLSALKDTRGVTSPRGPRLATILALVFGSAACAGFPFLDLAPAPDLEIVHDVDSDFQRITVVDTYPSKKTSAKGSPSKSVAISEVRLFGVPAAP